jgi:hypothetical protein
MPNIISAPLVFPKIEPDSWETWWSIWNKEASVIERVGETPNNLISPWTGFDIYVKPGFEENASNSYNFKNINRPDLFPSLLDNIDKFPVDIDVMRAASSFMPVVPHNDFIVPTYSVRTMLYDENPKQSWYYLFDNKVKNLLLPDNSNTWIYPDHESKHGSFYNSGYKKILILYYGKIKPELLENSLKDSEIKYKDYIIYK